MADDNSNEGQEPRTLKGDAGKAKGWFSNLFHRARGAATYAKENPYAAAIGGTKKVGGGLAGLFKPREPTAPGEQRKSPAGIILLIIIIGAVIAGAFFLFQTTSTAISAASQAPLINQMTQGGKGMMTSLKTLTKGFAGPLNILNQLWTTGTYSPGSQAQQVESEYIVPEDAGVTITDIRPVHASFYSEDEIRIEGTINIISPKLVRDDIDISFAPECPDCKSKIWDCKIIGETCADRTCTSIKQAYNKRFVCTNEKGIKASEYFTSEILMKWTYTTSAVGMKQVYVAKRSVLEQYEDPVAHFNINRSTIDPWQYSDGKINFAIGGDKDVSFIREALGLSPSTGFLEATPTGETSPTEYYFKASIKNTGEGNISKIQSLKLIFPQNSNILLTKQGFTLSEDTKNRNYTINNKPISILPGLYNDKMFIGLIVKDGFVGISDFNSFAVKGELVYDYTESIPVSVTIEPSPTRPSAFLKVDDDEFCFNSEEKGAEVAVTLSAIDPDGSIPAFSLCYGDGQCDSKDSPNGKTCRKNGIVSCTLTHKYLRTGDFTLIFIATDNSGQKSEDTKEIKVISTCI